MKMDYFKNKNNVSEYIKMAEGFDGKELIAVLKQHLPEGSSVLELGMGPGKDLDILSKTYQATGSDSSQVFLDLYKEKHPDADIMLLYAVSMETLKVFDCIYSNKVLVQLTTDELQQSFIKQKKVLKENGLLFHSFWYGDKQEEFNELFFQYYTAEHAILCILDHKGQNPLLTTTSFADVVLLHKCVFAVEGDGVKIKVERDPHPRPISVTTSNQARMSFG